MDLQHDIYFMICTILVEPLVQLDLSLRTILKEHNIQTLCPSELKSHQAFKLFVMVTGHKQITLLPPKRIFYPRDCLAI